MPYQTDANQKEIVGDLKRLGFSVEDLARHGRNCPDLLVANHVLTIAVEIKTETGKFRIGQLEWLAKWKGFCGYATTINKVLAMFNEPRVYCLDSSDKKRLLEFTTRWKLDGKGAEISLAHIAELLGK